MMQAQDRQSLLVEYLAARSRNRESHLQVLIKTAPWRNLFFFLLLTFSLTTMSGL